MSRRIIVHNYLPPRRVRDADPRAEHEKEVARLVAKFKRDGVFQFSANFDTSKEYVTRIYYEDETGGDHTEVETPKGSGVARDADPPSVVAWQKYRKLASQTYPGGSRTPAQEREVEAARQEALRLQEKEGKGRDAPSKEDLKAFHEFEHGTKKPTSFREFEHGTKPKPPKKTSFHEFEHGKDAKYKADGPDGREMTFNAETEETARKIVQTRGWKNLRAADAAYLDPDPSAKPVMLLLADALSPKGTWEGPYVRNKFGTGYVQAPGSSGYKPYFSPNQPHGRKLLGTKPA